MECAHVFSVCTNWNVQRCANQEDKDIKTQGSDLRGQESTK